MKRLHSPRPLLALLSALLVLTSSFSFAEEENKEAILKKLKTINIGHIEFSNTLIKDAVNELVRYSREADPAKQGINILLEGKAAKSEVTVSLNLKDVTLGSAIKFLTMTAGMKYRVENNAILIVTGETVDHVQTRIFNVAPGLFNSLIERHERKSSGLGGFGADSTNP